MSYSEEYQEHVDYMFTAFCRVVLRNAAFTAYRDFGRKQKREVSLDYLMSETPFEPFTTDSYFEQYDKPTVFVVQGQGFPGFSYTRKAGCSPVSRCSGYWVRCRG